MIYAINRVCSTFYNVPGYDICRIPDIKNIILFSTIAFIPSFFLPIRENIASITIWNVYFMHVFGSVFMIPFFSEDLSSGLTFSILVSVSYIFISISLFTDKIYIPSIKVSEAGILLTSLLFVGTAALYMIINFPFSIALPSLYEVYGVRAEFAHSLSQAGSRITGYIILISGFALAPIGIVLSLLFYKSNRILSCLIIFLSILLSLYIYYNAAFKSVAFAFIISGFLMVFLKMFRNSINGIFVFYISIFITVSMLDILNIDNNSLIHWFRRIFIVPGINSVFYLELFGLGEIALRNGTPQIVSEVFYGTSGSANSGIYGNGIARGGWVGIIANLSIFYLLIVLIRIISGNTPVYCLAAIGFMMSYALSNSQTTTVMLSYGGFYVLSVFFLLGCYYSSSGRRVHDRSASDA